MIHSKNIVDYSIAGRDVNLDRGMLEYLSKGQSIRFIDEDTNEPILIIGADPKDMFRFNAAVKASDPRDE